MDWTAETPPTARDIAAYYRREISEGQLPPLRQLPASRDLAKKLGVATMTVQAAYSQLRDEGLVVTRQGSGTFVRDAEKDKAGPRETALGLRELQSQLAQVSSQLADLSKRVAHLEATSTKPVGPEEQ